jgi:tRNA(fMet)-specific endonuclease VapC
LLTHLLDTNICIYAMKSRDLELSRRLTTLQGKCAVSDVSMFELYAGVDGYGIPKQRLEIIESFTTRISVLPFTTAIARIAGPLRYKLKTKGELIVAYDILIAATALSHNLILMTNNAREFNRVMGLKVEKWG